MAELLPLVDLPHHFTREQYQNVHVDQYERGNALQKSPRHIEIPPRIHLLSLLGAKLTEALLI